MTAALTSRSYIETFQFSAGQRTVQVSVMSSSISSGRLFHTNAPATETFVDRSQPFLSVAQPGHPDLPSTNGDCQNWTRLQARDSYIQGKAVWQAGIPQRPSAWIPASQNTKIFLSSTSTPTICFYLFRFTLLLCCRPSRLEQTLNMLLALVLLSID